MSNKLYFNCVSRGISIAGELTLADVVISNNAAVEMSGLLTLIGESGKRIFIFRPVSASKRDILVDMSGDPLYRRKKVGSWFFQARCSSANTLIVLFNVGMERSASPFASSQRGVILLRSIPKPDMKLVYYPPLNGGPLSILTVDNFDQLS